MQNYTEVLREMKDLYNEFRETLTWDPEKKERYDLLLAVRRERVKSFYRDGLVHTGSAAQSSAN